MGSEMCIRDRYLSLENRGSLSCGEPEPEFIIEEVRPAAVNVWQPNTAGQRICCLFFRLERQASKHRCSIGLGVAETATHGRGLVGLWIIFLSLVGPGHPYRCKSGSECYGFSPSFGRHPQSNVRRFQGKQKTFWNDNPCS